MSLRKPLVGLAGVMAALAIAAPGANASTATTAAAGTPLSLGCPIWYGIPNPANGCQPYWAYALGFAQNFWHWRAY
jgi:hypothetical protein